MLKDVLKLNALGKVGGGSGGGGDCDWNIMKNKPFYTEKGATVLPETAVEFDPDSGEGAIIDTIAVEAGKTYAVNWNGTEYTCTAVNFDLGGVLAATIGNVGAVSGGESTGESFVIMALPDEVSAEMGVGAIGIALDGSTSATVSIQSVIVYPLDEKYLPDLRAQKKVVLNFDEGTASISLADAVKMDLGELQSAMVAVYGGKEYACSNLSKTEQEYNGDVYYTLRFTIGVVHDKKAVEMYSCKWLHGGLEIYKYPVTTIETENLLVGCVYGIRKGNDDSVGHGWVSLADFNLSGITLVSPSGTKYKVTVDDAGNISATVTYD